MLSTTHLSESDRATLSQDIAAMLFGLETGETLNILQDSLEMAERWKPRLGRHATGGNGTSIHEVVGDVRGLRSIAEAWAAECNAAEMALVVDVDTHLADLQRLVKGENSALLVLVDRGEPVGYLGLTIFQSPIGPERICNEHCWYVLPDRRGPASLRLLKAAEQWAKARNCSHLIMTASRLSSGLHDKVCRLYERAGFQKFETSFIRKV